MEKEKKLETLEKKKNNAIMDMYDAVNDLACNRINDFECAVNELRAENNELRHQWKYAGEELKKKIKEKEDLTEELEELRQGFNFANSKYKSCRSTIGNLNITIADLRTENGKLKEVIEDDNGMNAHLINKVNLLEEELKKANYEKAEIENQKEELEGQYTDLMKYCEELEAVLEAVKECFAEQ